jgi:DNA-binding XRE family transcriptional regulator
MTLDEYLNRQYPDLNKANQNSTFGHRIGIERQSVERLRKFQREPSIKTAYRISLATGGAVQPFDFLTAEDRMTEKKQLVRV